MGWAGLRREGSGPDRGKYIFFWGTPSAMAGCDSQNSLIKLEIVTWESLKKDSELYLLHHAGQSRDNVRLVIFWTFCLYQLNVQWLAVIARTHSFGTNIDTINWKLSRGRASKKTASSTRAIINLHVAKVICTIYMYCVKIWQFFIPKQVNIRKFGKCNGLQYAISS